MLCIFLKLLEGFHFWLTRPMCLLHYKSGLMKFVVNEGLVLFLMFTWVFLFAFISGRKHLLSTLLSLEGLMLRLFGTLCYLGVMWVQFFSYLLVFLSFIACEGALGLSLLVIVVRWWGEDKVLSLNLML